MNQVLVVINSGSSSVKLEAYDVKPALVLICIANDRIEDIGKVPRW